MMPPVAILSGGKATRLYPMTQSIPKAMLELAGKPFIRHQMELLKNNDVKRVVICAGHLGQMLKEYVQKENGFGLAVDFSLDGDQLLGTAGAVKKALPLLGDSFAVIYGDSYLTEDFRPIAQAFLKSGKKGLMTVLKNESQWGPSNLIYDNGRILKYNKGHLMKEMKHIDYGLLFFKKEAFAGIKEGQVYDLANLCADLINEGQLAGYEVFKRFYEIGSLQGLEETRQHLQMRVLS